MQYTIHNIRHEPHDLDEDVVSFLYDIRFAGPEQVSLTYFLDMRRLSAYLQSAQPAFYEFYENTRRSLDLFGPAEIPTLEALGEEGLRQLYGYLEDYLLSCDWIPTLYADAQERSRHPEAAQRDAQAAFAKLSELAPGARRSSHRNRKFCNEVNRMLRETALRIFPEIADMEPEVIGKFKYFFVKDVLRISERVDKLVAYGRID